MKKNDEVYKFKKIIYTNIIMNFAKGLDIYNVLISPNIDFQIQNIVIVPVAPTELIARIAVRRTWYSIKETKNGKKLTYLFYMGKPELLNNSYPINYIYEESIKYNDILLFDIQNSYVNCTLLLLMCYKFVIENYHSFEYIIRVNSDMIFYPQKLDNMLYEKNDAIGYKTKLKGIEYLSGSFYVVKKSYLILILNESKRVIPLSFYDDVYFGQINKKTNYKSIAYINKYSYYIPVNNINQNMLYNKSSPIIGAHSVTSNAILYFWKYKGYKYSNS